VRPLGDDLWELRSPRLARAAQELLGLGVPLSESLDLAETLMSHADAVARTYGAPAARAGFERGA
jgi:hypothetical protein